VPYIFVTGYYPTHKAPEVIEKWIEVRKKFPISEFPGERVVDAAGTATKRGIETVTIYKCTMENFGKATMWLLKILTPYQSIEGFEYTVKPYATPEESLESAGMKIPE